MNKIVLSILKIVFIAFLLFLLKHFIQAIIEFTDIIPVRPKAYIWGYFDRAKYVVVWQFVFSFWVYILSVLLFIVLLKIKFLKKRKIWEITGSLSLIIMGFLLYVHRFEFPIKKTYFPSGKEINFGLIEDFIIYSIVGYLLIYLVRKWFLIDNNQKTPQ